MKIKLSNYGLVSIEWIDGQIDNLQKRKAKFNSTNSNLYAILEGNLAALQAIKQQLIPSLQLADVVYDCADVYGYNQIPKQDFLSSEIEIN